MEPIYHGELAGAIKLFSENSTTYMSARVCPLSLLVTWPQSRLSLAVSEPSVASIASWAPPYEAHRPSNVCKRWKYADADCLIIIANLPRPHTSQLAQLC